MLKWTLIALLMITAVPAVKSADLQLQQQQLTDYFFAAARTGNNDVLAEFLQAGFPVNLQNNESYTALMMATYYGHAATVNLLLSRGADACIRDKRDHTAMMGAIVKAEWAIARTLYRIDCDKQAPQPGMKTVEEFAEVFGQGERLTTLKQPLATEHKH